MTQTTFVASTAATVKGTSGTWSTCRDTSTDCWSGTGNAGGYVFCENQAGTYTTMRVVNVFDTSDIPNTAVIQSATLRLYCRVLRDDGTDCSITSMTATAPVCDNTEANYDASLAGAEVGTLTPGGTEDWTACAIDLSAIVKGGTTTLAVLEADHDAADSAPGAGEEYGFNFDDDAGTHPPELVVTYSLAGAVSDTADTQCRLWLMNPARGLAQPLLHWKDFQLEKGLFEAGTLTVTLHKDQVTATYGSDGALATDFGWHGTEGLWSLDYYHRGTRVFSGPIQTVVYSRDGHEGNAWVTVTAEQWLPALLRCRQVRTSTGAPFVVTNDSWRDIARQLVREQCDPDDIVTPTGWQQNAETRDDFGAFTVEVTANGDSGTEDYTVEVRTNLWDAVTELCNMPSSDDDKLWPTITESPAGTFTVNFLVGRSGGSRAIGTDNTGTIRFATPRRNLSRFEMVHDGASTENHLVSGGDGAGTSQSVRHAADDTSITTRNLGVREGVYDVPGGRDSYILDNELRMQLFRVKDPTTWTAQIVETADQQWPDDFDLKDSVTVYDEFYGETLTDMIIGVRLSYPAPGPYALELVFGQPPRNVLREMARAGGGAGGGRGGGGGGRNKDGSLNVYTHIDCTTGTVNAHEAATGLDLDGDGSGNVRVTTTASEQTGSGTDDGITIAVIGTYTVQSMQGVSGYVPISDGAGGTIYLFARNSLV